MRICSCFAWQIVCVVIHGKQDKVFLIEQVPHLDKQIISIVDPKGPKAVHYEKLLQRKSTRNYYNTNLHSVKNCCHNKTMSQKGTQILAEGKHHNKVISNFLVRRITSYRQEIYCQLKEIFLCCFQLLNKRFPSTKRRTWGAQNLTIRCGAYVNNQSALQAMPECLLRLFQWVSGECYYTTFCLRHSTSAWFFLWYSFST